jgi:mannosyltransferase
MSIEGSARGLRIAAVILARNEERTIGDAVEGAARYADAVHVMDGHSSDATASIAARTGAVVHLDPGRGKGSAIRRSLEIVDADVLVFMDADGSHDPADIPKLVAPVATGEADLCVGSRFAGGSEELSVSVGQLVRTIGNISMNIAINKRWNIVLTDTLNGFRAIRREHALSVGLVEDTHTIEQEMVMKMLRHGYTVVNVPTHERARRFGSSHINIWKEWPKFVRCVMTNLLRRNVKTDRHCAGGTRVSRRPQVFAVAAGILLLALGLWLPESWNTPLPQREPLPAPPFSGFWLLRASLAVEGIVLLIAGLRRWRWRPLDAEQMLPLPPPDEEPRGLGGDGWLLAGVTLFALILRVLSLDSELWLDEITPLLDYGRASAWQVVISYISSNNHLLHTLAMKTAISVFGEREWVIRLPQMLAGTATIPVMYWTARQASSRRASLAAALLLAVSYHHIFFSQNARAYAMYLLFSLAASVLLVKGLREDRKRVWLLYVTAMVLDFASILISGFVFAAHVVVGALAVMMIARRGRSPAPLIRRLIAVFTITGFLGFQLYAAVLPQIYVYIQRTYADPAAGFSPFSMELVGELARGLSAGFGAGLLFAAVPLLLIGTAGYVRLFRRNWPLTVALTAPAVLQAVLLAARQLALSPRFFILALPLAILVVVQGIEIVAAYVAGLLKRPRIAAQLTAALVMLLSIMSLSSLPRYYTVPKQAYRSSLAYIEATRRASDMVIVVHLAETGYRYYGQQFNVQEGQDYFYVRSVEALDHVLSDNPNRRSWLVVTFPRALQISLPGLYARIRRDWQVVAEFPGTVGDGQITLWRSVATGATPRGL